MGTRAHLRPAAEASPRSTARKIIHLTRGQILGEPIREPATNHETVMAFVDVFSIGLDIVHPRELGRASYAEGATDGMTRSIPRRWTA